MPSVVGNAIIVLWQSARNINTRSNVERFAIGPTASVRRVRLRNALRTAAARSISRIHHPPVHQRFRADESKCDFYENVHWPLLVDALRQAIQAPCVGTFRDGFPSRARVWIKRCTA